MSLIGIDIGTTHLKIGLYSNEGVELKVVIHKIQVEKTSEGVHIYDPEVLWNLICKLFRVVADDIKQQNVGPVRGIGVASMAETGLLVDRKTGVARTPLFGWFDKSAQDQAKKLKDLAHQEDHFASRGIRATYKCGLAKILWLREQDRSMLNNAVWLSTADYAAYRMTGEFATVYSLAGRTYAFEINNKRWQTEWLSELGLDTDIFPNAVREGTQIGYLIAHRQLGLSENNIIPVIIAGHDHICGAFGACMLNGGIGTGLVVDSIGTTESLVGTIPDRPLNETEIQSGFSFGCHVAPGYKYWAGGLSTSGGALEWIKGIINESDESYGELNLQLDGKLHNPGELLFLPYLQGSGSPHTNTDLRGAFIGLSMEHSSVDLYRAVLEGTAFEAEFMRREAEIATGNSIEHLVAIGGGTKNQRWMQIKADISGCPIDVLEQSEMTLMGAAFLAGMGAGFYRDLDELNAALKFRQKPVRYEPDLERHQVYKKRYKDGWLAVQEPIRRFFSNFN